MRVIQGTASRSRQSAIEAAYEHFRVDRQGNFVSGNTLEHYHHLVGPFFEWLRDERPGVDRFQDLDVNVVRDYRLALTRRISGRTGRPYEPATILDAPGVFERGCRRSLPSRDCAVHCTHLRPPL